jgi:Fe2+ transport system protein FeoA
MTLDSVKLNNEAEIKNIIDRKNYLYLLENGFIPGEKVKVIAKAPFFGPISIKIRNTVIALRTEEAKKIVC